MGSSNEVHVGAQIANANVVFQENTGDPWMIPGAEDSVGPRKQF
jgi:hypothetical protein